MKSLELLHNLEKQVNEMATAAQAFLATPYTVLNARPEAAAWSILECFEHLNRYLRFYNSAIAKKITSGNGPLDVEVKSTWIGRKSIAAMHPSNRKKQKTLKHMNPLDSQLSETVITEFLQHQKDLISLLGKSRSVDVNQIKVPIEFFRLATMTLAEAFQFVIVHQQRHMLQIQNTHNAVKQSRSASLVV